MNYQLTVNLRTLRGAEDMEKEGVKGIFIPYDGNLFDGKKGAYLSLQAFEYKKMVRGCTHWMQKYARGEEEIEAQKQLRKDHKLPYYGTMKPLFFKKSEK